VQAIARVDSLHPNCFSHDGTGQPLLPPLCLEPGVGVVRWLDDRFLLSFVSRETARRGKELSLSPLELSVLQLYGQFLARGDIFNYRGERLSDNFMAEYASDVEQKATVKFTGEQKKITYGTSTTEHDAASRDDAVRDYIDFIFHALNNLPLPKRITPRKAGVILKYCVFRDAACTAGLVLRFVAAHDFQLAREILFTLAHRDTAKVVALIQGALETDPQAGARYRRDLTLAVRDVMGREFLAEAQGLGLLRKETVEAVRELGQLEQAAASAAANPEPAQDFDYFDV
jgi:hypothetical protein